MAEQCWKCGTPVDWSDGIGAFCPNPRCDVVDALEREQAFEVRILLAPLAAAPAAPVPPPVPAGRCLELAPPD